MPLTEEIMHTQFYDKVDEYNTLDLSIPFQSPYHPEGGVGGGLIVPKVSS